MGGYIDDIKVISPEKTLEFKNCFYVITSLPGRDSIKTQLLDFGIREQLIDDSFITLPLESRRIFLENVAEILPENVDYAVAEAGVFEGDFAKYINKYFPDRNCYLFDTFEGFDERDLVNEAQYSSAVKGDYQNTSEKLVLSKMPNKDRVRVCKGYFPESAIGVCEKFGFVNLDLDLYEPTYKGLQYFERKMIKDGIILVHDYFSENFRGPYDAVNRFLYESGGKYDKAPIGDGISIMIVGFR